MKKHQRAKKTYKIVYKDGYGEIIYTFNVGPATFKVAEEFAATYCPRDRSIETYEVVPIESIGDSGQLLPSSIGFPDKRVGVISNRATGDYVKHTNTISISQAGKKSKKLKEKKCKTQFGQIPSSIGFSSFTG